MADLGDSGGGVQDLGKPADVILECSLIPYPALTSICHVCNIQNHWRELTFLKTSYNAGLNLRLDLSIREAIKKYSLYREIVPISSDNATIGHGNGHLYSEYC